MILLLQGAYGARSHTPNVIVIAPIVIPGKYLNPPAELTNPIHKGPSADPTRPNAVKTDIAGPMREGGTHFEESDMIIGVDGLQKPCKSFKEIYSFA